MDKFEYKVRADEIKELITEGNYAEAAEIADTIDWRRIKSVMMLCMISDLYKMNQRYEDAKNILLLAYDKRAGGRSICYSLCELCLKTGEFVEAIDYYKEFIQIAPNDSGRYILHYKILEAQDVSLEERIEVLEELKKVEHREKWLYELAYLYHRVGEATRCVEECDEIILWFGEGKYVIKAMELKMQHRELSPEQQEKYDMYMKATQKQAAYAEAPAEQTEAEAEASKETPVEKPDAEVSEIRVEPLDEGDYNSIKLEQELAAGLQEVLTEPEEKEEIPVSVVVPEDIQETKVFVSPAKAENMGLEEIREPEEYEEPKRFVEPEQYGEQEELPLDLAQVLSQESDGQIRMVVPETEIVEKQITGQMNLDDILAEWERMKLQNEKRQKEEVRRRVLEQTGAIFTEFEESIRDGLLERLEKAPLEPAEEKMTIDPNWDDEEEEAVVEPEVEEVYEEEEVIAEPEVEEVYEEEEVIAEPEVEEVYEEEEVIAEPEVEEVYEEEEVIAEPEVEEVYEEEEAVAEPEVEEVYEEAAYAQEVPAVRGLTTEEKTMYGSIIQGKSARENLARTIDEITITPGVGNLILAGDDGRKTMILAKNLIRQLQMAEPGFVGKVAKITGEGMNNRDAHDTVSIFDKGALIIQSASGMEESTAYALCDALCEETAEIFVILEDTAKGMEWLFAQCPELAESFTNRIDLMVLKNEELIEYGIQYAKEREYSIDQRGILALHSKVDELQTLDHAVTIEEVQEIVEQAIQRASKKSVRHFMDVLFAKRYDEDDMIIITEKDFA